MDGGDLNNKRMTKNASTGWQRGEEVDRAASQLSRGEKVTHPEPHELALDGALVEPARWSAFARRPRRSVIGVERAASPGRRGPLCNRSGHDASRRSRSGMEGFQPNSNPNQPLSAGWSTIQVARRGASWRLDPDTYGHRSGLRSSAGQA